MLPCCDNFKFSRNIFYKPLRDKGSIRLSVSRAQDLRVSLAKAYASGLDTVFVIGDEHDQACTRLHRVGLK